MRWILLCAALASPAAADMMIFEDFSAPVGLWTFVSDRVMGGVSQGQAQVLSADGAQFARLSGAVSTANNGGFIQFRREVAGLPAETTALRLRVRGNGQRYYVHLRTDASWRPWEFYQAPFEVTRDWQEVRIPLSDFTAQGRFLTRPLTPGEVTSIGLVAYGRTHQAGLDVARIVLE